MTALRYVLCVVRQDESVLCMIRRATRYEYGSEIKTLPVNYLRIRRGLDFFVLPSREGLDAHNSARARTTHASSSSSSYYIHTYIMCGLSITVHYTWRLILSVLSLLLFETYFFFFYDNINALRNHTLLWVMADISKTEM